MILEGLSLEDRMWFPSISRRLSRRRIMGYVVPLVKPAARRGRHVSPGTNRVRLETFRVQASGPS